MNLINYIQAKGRKEREFLRLTGKRQMRIGKRLKQEFAGLTREQMAERLIARHARGSHSPSVEQEFVLHSLALRPGRTAHLELPADLTTQEAQKLAKFIQILPSNAE
jgi:hypothetical protein